MKRSKMIDILSALIDNHYTRETWDSFSIERQIKHILGFVEDLEEEIT